ncbi:MAG TPA: flavin reductase family protein [Mycobacterium sp.]|jgi:flavin reductase (DIM6/NTAB) family NADH-FMN oxidoreductase RutF|nr:flavin reductase family protein [Mycobacterium sp.]
MDDESFDQLVSMLDYTMFVVTTQADGHPSGCLVGFATQTSLRPRRFLAGLSRRNHTTRVARRAEYLAVHLLSRRHIDLARLFGGQTGDLINKFDHCSWHDGPKGMPILDDAVAWFVGKILRRIDLGDHVGYLLGPIAGFVSESSEELVNFSDVADLEPGHEA